MLDMPPFVVLIVCKVALTPVGPVAEHNARFTGHHQSVWAIEHGKMHCRRHEIQVYDQARAQGADAQSFNKNRCQRAGIMQGSKFNETHKKWKWWRTACPTPIVDLRTGKVLGWQMPDCGGERGTIVCESDTSI